MTELSGSTLMLLDSLSRAIVQIFLHTGNGLVMLIVVLLALVGAVYGLL